MYLKKQLFLSLLLLPTLIYAQQTGQKISIGGNAFITNSQGARITEKGIENWTNPKEIITVYLRISKPGTLIFSISETSNLVGKSVLEFTINGLSKRLILDEAKKYEGAIGEWTIKDTGYVALSIKGISRTKNIFPSIVALNLGGTAVNEQTSYVKNNEGAYFYWGRRGPSVHLTYQIPENLAVSWFYNEIIVPKGNDVIGSYFMANGFGEGYFGIQVNSKTERRILFSVWSPFKTDNPKEIPESHKIRMLKKGKDVYTGEFGNEGSGGQSFLRYNWKAGNTYRFLLHAEPSVDNYTTYTAYFFAPELNSWQLIASFKRPQTQTFLKRLHSFLENFIPEYGNQTRSVYFKNQWIYDDKGNWLELNNARFTTDNTGNINYRKDYAGGANDNYFFLKNCGFFSDYSPAKSIFTRKSAKNKPEIDFNSLSKLN
jgi:hypothetical protein